MSVDQGTYISRGVLFRQCQLTRSELLKYSRLIFHICLDNLNPTSTASALTASHVDSLARGPTIKIQDLRSEVAWHPWQEPKKGSGLSLKTLESTLKISFVFGPDVSWDWPIGATTCLLTRLKLDKETTSCEEDTVYWCVGKHWTNKLQYCISKTNRPTDRLTQIYPNYPVLYLLWYRERPYIPEHAGKRQNLRQSCMGVNLQP